MEDMGRPRPLDANDVADWFINVIDRQAGEVITTLEVQRLVFFAQAWHLANTGRPLFADDFEAWSTGPVAPNVFERFRDFTYSTVPAMEQAREVKGQKLDLLLQVQDEYGCYRGRKLDELSREPGGPWEKARGGISEVAACDAVIAKDAIRKFYGAKIGKSWP
jgi:uncharacterized phage-associated protein